MSVGVVPVPAPQRRRVQLPDAGQARAVDGAGDVDRAGDVAVVASLLHHVRDSPGRALGPEPQAVPGEPHRTALLEHAREQGAITLAGRGHDALRITPLLEVVDGVLVVPQHDVLEVQPRQARLPHPQRGVARVGGVAGHRQRIGPEPLVAQVDRELPVRGRGLVVVPKDGLHLATLLPPESGGQGGFVVTSLPRVERSNGEGRESRWQTAAGSGAAERARGRPSARPSAEPPCTPVRRSNISGSPSTSPPRAYAARQAQRPRTPET